MNKEKPHNGGRWTIGRYNSFITSILRSGSRRWPPKFDTLKEAFVGKKLNESTKRIGNHYLCAGCLDEFPSSQVQVDHIEPIGFNLSWDEFIQGLFCEADNLQVLCKSCHKKKTLEERRKNEDK